MNIDLTDREIQLLIDCIGTNIETVKRRHDEADPFIAELLTELADNVIHHGGSNATVNVNHDGDWFLFEDTGQGVPERIRNEVFVVFRPVAHSKSERLGMGLCRCSSILESLGGSIEMECPDNGGTIIRFRL